MGVDDSSKPRVLLVEDDDLVAGSIRRWLDRSCSVHVASSIKDGLAAIGRGGWDAFLIDVYLVDGVGVSLLAPIREQHPTQKIVLMTGGDPTLPSHEALMHHATFVVKPLPDHWLKNFHTWIRGDELALRLRALGLTNREVEVFSILATGATAKMAGVRLGISERTVQGHCFAVYSRLHLGSLTEVLAMAHGWQG